MQHFSVTFMKAMEFCIQRSTFSGISFPIFFKSQPHCSLSFVVIEFLSSQSPYAMKGLIFGMLFTTMFTIILVIGVPVISLFLQHFSIWSTKTISCGFWYTLMVIIVYSIAFACFSYLTKKYKMKKREDVLPNEHIFAERYYSRET